MNTGGRLERTIAPNEEPSLVIILMLAQLEDVEPEAVSPLFESVDLEALDTLIAHPNPRTEFVQCEFCHGNYRIEIEKQRTVSITVESID